MFVVTKDWITENKTPRGGYIKAQLEILGEDFPPKKGWKERAAGRQITEVEQLVFELAAQSRSAAKRAAKNLPVRAEKRAKNQTEAQRIREKLKAINEGAHANIANAAKIKSATAGVNGFIANSKIDPTSDAFLRSFEWRAARMMAIKRYGPVCQCCGASPKTGAVINVDHIKPRKLFPELALDQDNLQVLCNDCNAGKGNWDQTDWRVAA